MALEGQAQLKNAEAQKDDSNGFNQGEDKVTQVVDRRQRVAGGNAYLLSCSDFGHCEMGRLPCHDG